jgi:hypothetical protein
VGAVKTVEGLRRVDVQAVYTSVLLHRKTDITKHSYMRCFRQDS